MDTETIWIFNFRGVLLELAVNEAQVVVRADGPMEWAVGEKWGTVKSLFEVLGTVTPKDPQR